MIFAFTLAYSPEDITPVIAFDEFSRIGHDELELEGFVLVEFLLYDFLHGQQPEAVPIRTKGELHAHALGLSRCSARLDCIPVRRQQALGSLIGVFSTGPASIAYPEWAFIEVGKPAIFTIELVYRLPSVVTLSQFIAELVELVFGK